jgi:hypothetical protein
MGANPLDGKGGLTLLPSKKFRKYLIHHFLEIFEKTREETKNTLARFDLLSS